MLVSHGTSYIFRQTSMKKHTARWSYVFGKHALGTRRPLRLGRFGAGRAARNGTHVRGLSRLGIGRAGARKPSKLSKARYRRIPPLSLRAICRLGWTSSRKCAQSLHEGVAPFGSLHGLLDGLWIGVLRNTRKRQAHVYIIFHMEGVVELLHVIIGVVVRIEVSNTIEAQFADLSWKTRGFYYTRAFFQRHNKRCSYCCFLFVRWLPSSLGVSKSAKDSVTDSSSPPGVSVLLLSGPRRGFESMVVGVDRLYCQIARRDGCFLMDFEDVFVSGIFGAETVDSYNMNEE